MQKTVLITGANGNLGTAVVKKFLEEQYRVVAVDRTDDHLQFAKGNPAFEWYNVNLTDEKITQDFIHTIIKKCTTIDAALLLVGGFAMGKLEQTDGASIKKMFTLNFDTAFYPARLLFQHMLQKEYGRIVFVGARPALKPSQGKNMVAYSLSKSLLFSLASMMNEEAIGKNVAASVIVPSTIDTPANRESMQKANPADWVSAEQIADTLLMICSEKGLPLREMVYKLYNNA